MRNILLLLSVFCLTVVPLHAQSKKELRKQKAAEEFSNTRNLIDSGKFRFTPQRAFPTGGRSIDVTSHNAYLDISNDSATAVLPFFGRAGDVAYSTDQGGLKFEGMMEGINRSVDEKKQSIGLTFYVKHGREKYNCHFNITGITGTLSITSNQRSQISYDGVFSARE